jgi:methylmalonyl-CoA mutase N-terminal domain/subunit
MVAAIERSFPQREIADASFRYQTEVDSRKRIVVGVNDYVNDTDDEIPTLKVDRALEAKQTARLEATRASRDSAAVESSLADLKAAAQTDANLMPLFLAAARARATEGEMVAALQEVFGDYTEMPVF